MNYANLTRIGDTVPVAAQGKDFSSSPDYAVGESKVQSLVQYFNSLGRPKAFEADVEALYAAYETAAKSKSTVVMKQAGEAADVLLGKIKDAHGDEGNFLERKYGGITVWQWGLGGLGLIGLALLARKALR